MALDPEVRAILVCPTCRGELADVARGLVCRACDALYPVVDDVPMMIPEMVQAPTPEEREAARR